MKTKQLLNFVLATLLFSFELSAQTDNVTFRVDMGSTTVESGGVHVIGNFNGFNASANLLTQEGATTIYSATIAIDVGSWYEYKFITDDNYATGVQETPNQPCAGTNGNRYLYVNNSNTDITLEVVPFGGCNASGTGFTATFNVDLSSEGSISADGVHVTGTFNGFNTSTFPLLNVTGLTASTTFRLPTPADYDVFFDYKYINGNSFATAETPSANCSTVDATNRKITLSNSNENVFDIFNGCSTQTWNGNADTAWSNTANWPLSTVPVSSGDNVIIPSGLTNNPVIGATTSAVTNNITIDGLANLSITSGGSLIVNGTSTGNITYNLAIQDTNWHLVSSPVVGEVYDNDWMIANNIATGTVAANRGISTYDNDIDANGDWVYFQTGGSATYTSGVGYSLLRTTTGIFGFTGTVPTADVNTAISRGFSGNNRLNLIGNPFPSYIDIDAFLNLNDNALTEANEAVYIWNGTTYVASATGFIHPGQAFFVYAENLAPTNISLTEDILSGQTGVTFLKNNDPSISLFIKEGSSKKSTEINYLADKTTGLDPRFDIGAFTGSSNNGKAGSFEIFTQLVEDNDGINFARQTLPNGNYESMVVPVGLNADAGKEIIFTVDAQNLPDGINVYLEDRLLNTFTRLDEANSNYKVTLTNVISGTGRFYIRTAAKALNTDLETLNSVHIYKTNTRTLRVAGLQNGETSLEIYNLLGKQVVSRKFLVNGVEDISLSNLAIGIYIVKLQNKAGTISKKIILE